MTQEAYARGRVRRLATEILDWLRGCDFHIDEFDRRPFQNRALALKHYAAAAELDKDGGNRWQSYVEEVADMLIEGRYMPAASRLSTIIRELT